MIVTIGVAMKWLWGSFGSTALKDSRRAADAAAQIREAAQKKAAIELELLDMEARRASAEQQTINRLGNEELFGRYGEVLLEYREFAQTVERGVSLTLSMLDGMRKANMDASSYEALKAAELEYAEVLDNCRVRAVELLASMREVQAVAYQFLRDHKINPFTLRDDTHG